MSKCIILTHTQADEIIVDKFVGIIKLRVSLVPRIAFCVQSGPM